MTGRHPRSWSVSSLAIFGLWAVAVAQPLLDLLSRNPEFFVAHQAGRSEILILVATLMLLGPAILIAGLWIAGLAGPTARGISVATCIAAFAGVVAVQVAEQVGVTSWMVAIPAAAIAGIACAFAYQRFAAVRMFAAAMSLAALVAPAMFLTRPAIRRLLVPPALAARSASAAIEQVRPRPGVEPGPVVMLVIDETPLVSLLDADGRIDPVLYPNLSALAGDGIWYRNATTVSDYTRWALPAILTGKYPRADSVPTLADHPDTLFTLLGQAYELEVVQAVTDLCPEDLCGPPVLPFGERLSAMAADVRILMLHLLLTDDLRAGLPDLTADWAGFGDDFAREQRRRRRAVRQSRPRDKKEVALAFVDWISSEDPPRTFYFLHTLLPHFPHPWLPSGQRNGTRAAVPAEVKTAWSDDEWGVIQQYQRHLLTIGLVDTIVGRLINRLRTAGLYDRALIVVTADHGISFLTDAPRRSFTERTAAAIMRVPLIIKLPAGLGVGGRVSDRNAETVDIAPTVADALGIELSWKADGASLLDESRPERGSKKMFFDSARRTRTYAPNEPDTAGLLRRKIEIFGGSDNFYRVPRPARFGDLVGRPVNEVRLEDGGGRLDVDFASSFDVIDTKAETVPFDLGGRVAEARPDGRPTYVAVAINGTIRVVTQTWSSQPQRWLATPPLDAWRDRANQIEIFVVDEDADGTLLRRTVSR